MKKVGKDYRKKHDGETAAEALRGYEKLDQFEIIIADHLTAQALDLRHPDRKVVSLGSSGDLKALEACLIETDPAKTDVVIIAFAHRA